MLLNNLAVVHNWSNDPAGARPLLERAMGIQEKTLGPKHPSLGSGYMNLGDILARTGDPEAAKVSYVKAAAIFEEASPEHPELARVLSHHAFVVLGQGDTGEARRLYERSHRDQGEGPRCEPPRTGGEPRGSRPMCTQGGWDEAGALFERALSLSRRPDGGYYPQAIWTVNGYAGIV